MDHCSWKLETPDTNFAGNILLSIPTKSVKQLSDVHKYVQVRIIYIMYSKWHAYLQDDLRDQEKYI
jgi:hypothetical protein